MSEESTAKPLSGGQKPDTEVCRHLHQVLGTEISVLAQIHLVLAPSCRAVRNLLCAPGTTACPRTQMTNLISPGLFPFLPSLDRLCGDLRIDVEEG